MALSIRIFISYTLRGSDINSALLGALKRKLESIEGVCVYVDILDNDSTEHQKRVFDEILEADVLCLIKSNEINKSMWVKTEVEYAKKNDIPILLLNIGDIHRLLKLHNADQLKGDAFLENIIAAIYGRVG